MKKLLLLLLLAASVLSPAASAQTTTTLTGTVRDLSNAAVTSGQVSFTLQPGIDTAMSGTARFTPSEIDCTITGAGAVKALDGVSTCTVVNNTALQPSGTSYKVCIQPQFIQPGSCFVWYATGGSVDITQQVPTPPLTPAYNLVDTFSNQTVGGNKTFSGNITFGGTLSLGAITLGGNLALGANAITSVTGITDSGDETECALCVRKWGSSGTSSPDAGFSRIAAGVIGAGNGVQADASASFRAKIFQIGGSDTGLSRDAADVVDCGNGTQGDKSCNLKLATITLGKSDGTLPATIGNDGSGGLNLFGNGGAGWELLSTGRLFGSAGKDISFGGATSGFVSVIAPATAGGTNTLQNATDTFVYRATTDTLTNKGFGDKVLLYNNIATVSNGLPSILAAVDTTGLQANVSATTLYAVPASGAGLYEISAYTKLTTAGSVSSTLPQVLIASTDADDSTIGIQMPCTPNGAGAGMGQIAANTNNTVNLSISGVCVVNAKASTNIQYLTSGYASNAAGMTYAIHIKLKKL